MNARVVVVGGPGAMGRHAVRKLALLEHIATIVVADIDEERAGLLAEEIGPKAMAVALDVRDDEQLDRVFAGSDIVVNAMGPFVTFGKAVLTAAIRNDCDYIDIDDDWDATVEALELDQAARDAGVTAIIGVGMSPGVTNLLAVQAAARLDEVHRIYTGWKMSGTGTDFEPRYDSKDATPAAVAHWVLQCSGQIQAWRDGEAAMVEPLEIVNVNYPGVGVQQAWSLGHPEPITLPRHFDGLDESLNMMTGPGWMFESLREIAIEFSADRIDLDEALVRVAAIERPADPAATPRDPMPPAWALVEGRRDGRTVTIGAHLTSRPPHRMGGGTGYPLAVGVQMMLEGLVTERGVLTPELALGHTEFFDRLAPMVDPPVADGAALVTLVENEGPATA